MTLTDFFDAIYRPQRLLGKSSETTRLYKISIRKFSRIVKTDPTLDHLTDTNLIAMMQHALDHGRSPATANKDRNQLLTLWRHAHRLGMVDRWPNVPALTEPQRTPEAWLADDLTMLMAAIRRQTGEYDLVPRSLWWETLVRIGLDTGERIGAIRDAKFAWIKGEWINFPAESRKGKHRDRAYRLSPLTTDRLAQVRRLSPKWILPWPFTKTYLWISFTRLLDDAGLPSTARHKFHMLRRTTGSVAHAAGLDAQDVLDHQHRRTTQRYLDPRFSRDRQACDVLADYLANPSQPESRKKLG